MRGNQERCTETNLNERTQAMALNIVNSNTKYALKPLHNIGKTKKKKCLQIYT